MEALAPFAPLLQTVLWVGLIVWIVLRYHTPLLGVLTALLKRIESGGTVKLGSLELGDLRPQAPAEQREKIAAEVAEALPPPVANRQHDLRVEEDYASLIFQAEDLAIRALQAEYGHPINRQVVLGSLQLDGTFVANGCLNIVEVKYLPDRSSIPRLQKSLEAITKAVARMSWKKVQIILVVVFENDDDVALSDAELLEVSDTVPLQVTIKPFSIKQLRNRFGIGPAPTNAVGIGMPAQAP